MLTSSKERKQNEENEQEENLLINNHLQDPINQPGTKNEKKKHKYLPFLPKIYWFFYSKPIYFLAFIPSLINGFITTGETYSLALVIDCLNKENSLELLRKYVLYQLLLIIVNSVLSFISEYSWDIINSLITIKLRRTVFKAIMMKDIEFFDKKSFGELNSVLDYEIEGVGNMFFESKSILLFSIGHIISGTILCFSIEWRLTLFALVITLFNSKMIGAFFEFGMSKVSKRFEHLSDSTNILSEAISNIKTVFSFNRQKKLLHDYDFECEEMVKLEQQCNVYFGIPSHVMSVLAKGALCTFLNAGSFFVLKGEITAGFLFTISQEAFNLANEIEMIFGLIRNEKEMSANMKNVFEIIEYQSTVPFTNEGKEIHNFSGLIEFKDVWFKYPTRNTWVLKNISFQIAPSEITAFVGHSGSGKSTVLQLILRFYDVSMGSILFDGVDIKDLDPRWIRRVISVVQQDPVLFSMSIRDNVLYRLDDNVIESSFSEEKLNSEVDRCLKIAQAFDFVQELPEKRDSMIGEKGCQLSGGQKQRVAIARAMINDPIVLIADEATSALDVENEKKVQNALNEAMKGRTCILIAHRLATISQAKKIYVFESGEIVEYGTRSELIEKKGAFYNLVERQLNLNS
ncbi:hypothetical protein M9Y10_000391 [Tritrichomonas musculus]|uniref:ABC transporter family protein n=1 Tax=Tritrichomonas musculus TaxID=1915356 RepID=A0ABR2L434_9EUKA